MLAPPREAEEGHVLTIPSVAGGGSPGEADGGRFVVSRAAEGLACLDPASYARLGYPTADSCSNHEEARRNPAASALFGVYGPLYISLTLIIMEAIMDIYCLPPEIPMPSLRIGRRGQITIPSALRRELQLEEGAHLIAQVRDGALVLRPAGRSIFALRGSVAVDGPQDFEAIRAQAIEERVRRVVDESR